MTSYKRRSYSVGSSSTNSVIQWILQDINSPRSLAVWLLYKSGEHDQLLQLECDPLHYNSPFQFADDLLATSLLSKADFLSTTIDTKSVAIEKFLQSEELCRLTNRRILPFLPGGLMPPGELHHLIPKVRSQIEKILGRFDVHRLFDDSGWGPGVSALMKGETSVKPNKYQFETGMTREVHSVVWPLLQGAYPGWWNEILSKLNPTILWGNTITTVPKNSKTDRVIAIEPGWNLWFQKGIGEQIRRRLRRFGCELNDQGRNQSLARVAFSRRLATVDFSSASDTIAKRVCELLLPQRWYTVMELFRSHLGDIEGEKVLYEKFSSMGNGFTFELESLLFYSCALACCPSDEHHNVSVYGDDVILPAQYLPLFRELVATLGFVISAKKSFSSGCYYESCGSHFFRGVDVKPFFLKRKLKKVWDVFLFHNNLMAYAHQLKCCWALDKRFKGTISKIQDLVDPVFRLCRTPRHLGSMGFSCNLDYARPKVKLGFGYEATCLASVAVKLPFDGYGLLLDRVREIHPSTIGLQQISHPPFPKADGNSVPIKGRVKYRKSHVRVPFDQWYNFGRWE